MPDQSFENLQRKKSDLSLVIVPVIVKAVPANPVAGDALNLRYLNQRITVRRPAVMAKVIVPRRNENLADQHRDGGNLTDAEPNLANDLRAESLLQFAQYFGLGNLLELVVQRRLQDPHRKNARA